MAEAELPDLYSQSIFIIFHTGLHDTIFEFPIHVTSQDVYRCLQDRLILIALSLNRSENLPFPRNYFILGKKGVTERDTPEYDRRGECIQLFSNSNSHVFMAQTLDAILPMEQIEGEWVTMKPLLSKKNKLVFVDTWEDMPDKDLVYFIQRNKYQPLLF